MFQNLLLFNNFLIFFLNVVVLLSSFIIVMGLFYLFLLEKSINKLLVRKCDLVGNTLFNAFFNLLFFFIFCYYYYVVSFSLLQYIIIDVLVFRLWVLLLTFCLSVGLYSWFYYDKSTVHSFFMGLSFFTIFFFNCLASIFFNFANLYIFFFLYSLLLFFKKPKEQFVLRNKKAVPTLFLKKNN